MPRHKSARIKSGIHLSIDSDDRAWLLDHPEYKASKFLADAIHAVRMVDPQQVRLRLSSEKAELVERLSQIEVELQSVAEAEKAKEKVKAEVPATVAPIEIRTKLSLPTDPEWLRRLKRAIAELKGADREAFLTRHQIERITTATISEEKGRVLIAEAEIMLTGQMKE